ncbi:MAG: hypothetical protein E6G97_22655 [Alphaproteobacteria bacterium]|nr:MAG: hypothetical protein E6G97_22655 [Alphaproteobacteria bacterium]
MSTYEVKYNVFNGGDATSSVQDTGHINVSLIKDGEVVKTVGATTYWENFILNGNLFFPGIGLIKDGIVQDETATLLNSAGHFDESEIDASARFVISEEKFSHALDYLNGIDGKMFDYHVTSCSCATFVSFFNSEILKEAGSLADKFSTTELQDVVGPIRNGILMPYEKANFWKAQGYVCGFDKDADGNNLLSSAAPAVSVQGETTTVNFGSGDVVTTSFNQATGALSATETYNNAILYTADWNPTIATVSTFSSGFLEHITAFPANGMQIDTAFAPDGSKIETTTDLSNQHSWDKEIVSKDASGADAAKIDVNDNGTVSDPALASTSLAGDLGSLFGSKLGLLIGGNSLAGQLAAGTVMGAIGKEVGNALFASGSFSLDLVVEHAFGSLAGGSGVGSLPSGAIATVSSLLMAELADALNLHGFEGGLFQTAGTTITTQLVTNAYGMMTGATVNGLPNGPAYTMFTGFDSGAIFLNLSGAVAGYLGSTLAAHIATPHYAEGALGQQIGSSVGGLIGVWFGGPVGAFLGSFVGGVAGSILGDLAGNDPESHGRLTFQSGYFFPDPHSFWGDHGANGATFMNIATYTGNVVNGLADFAGVHMTLPPLPGGAVIPGGQTLDLLYTQYDHDFFINENGHPAFVWLHNVQHADDLAPLVTTGVMDLVHHVDVAGGDPLVGLAWKNSHADNPSAFALDLQVA